MLVNPEFATQFQPLHGLFNFVELRLKTYCCKRVATTRACSAVNAVNVSIKAHLNKRQAWWSKMLSTACLVNGICLGF